VTVCFLQQWKSNLWDDSSRVWGSTISGYKAAVASMVDRIRAESDSKKTEVKNTTSVGLRYFAFLSIILMLIVLASCAFKVDIIDYSWCFSLIKVIKFTGQTKNLFIL